MVNSSYDNLSSIGMSASVFGPPNRTNPNPIFDELQGHE